MRKHARIPALLLAVLLLFSLCACGREKTDGMPELKPEIKTDDQHQKPVENEGEPALYREYDYPYGGVTLSIPVEAADPKDTGSSLLFTDPNGAWELELKPLDSGHARNDLSNVDGSLQYNADMFLNVVAAERDWGGWPAQVRIFDLNPDASGTLLSYDASHCMMFTSFVPRQVAGWEGFMADFRSTERYANVAELMADPLVNEIVNGIRFHEATETEALGIPGISVEFPPAWNSSVSEPFCVFAGITGETRGSIFITATTPADAATAAGYAGNKSEGSINGRTWYTVWHEYSEEIACLELYTDFNKNYCIQVKLSLAEGGEAAHREFLAGDTMTSVMNSLVLDPDSFADPELDRIDASGFTCDTVNCICDYSGPGGDIVIPAFIGSNPIYGLSVGLFEDNSSITSVVVSEGITYIAPDAFRGCSALESVTLPSTVMGIGSEAFLDCSSLKSIRFGAGLKKIEYSAFENCSALTGIELPEGVVSVDRNAFNGAGCGGSFSCGSGVSFGDYALACSGFEKIELGKDSDLSADYILSQSASRSVSIGEGTQVIGSYFLSPPMGEDEDGFLDFIDLPVTVSLPDSIRTIGQGAFQNCGIETINLASVSELGSDAFSSTKLRSVSIPGTLKEIPDYAFEYCPRLCEVRIGDGVERIGSCAFYGAGRQFNSEAMKGTWINYLDEEQYTRYKDAVLDPERDGVDYWVDIYMPKSVSYVDDSAFGGLYLHALWFNETASPDELPEFHPDAFNALRGCFQIFFSEETINACGDRLDDFFERFDTVGRCAWFDNSHTKCYFTREKLDLD